MILDENVEKLKYLFRTIFTIDSPLDRFRSLIYEFYDIHFWSIIFSNISKKFYHCYLLSSLFIVIISLLSFLAEISTANSRGVQFRFCIFVYVSRRWKCVAWIFASNFRVNFRARSNPMHGNMYHACRSISFHEDYGFLNLSQRTHVQCVHYMVPCIRKWYVHHCSFLTHRREWIISEIRGNLFSVNFNERNPYNVVDICNSKYFHLMIFNASLIEDLHRLLDNIQICILVRDRVKIHKCRVSLVFWISSSF